MHLLYTQWIVVSCFYALLVYIAEVSILLIKIIILYLKQNLILKSKDETSTLVLSWVHKRKGQILFLPTSVLIRKNELRSTWNKKNVDFSHAWMCIMTYFMAMNFDVYIITTIQFFSSACLARSSQNIHISHSTKNISFNV